RRLWSIERSPPRLPSRSSMTPRAPAAMADGFLLSQVNVRAAGDVVARLGRALGAALPVEPNTVATVGARNILWLGPDEWLVLDGPDMAAEAEAHARPALDPDWGSV